MQLFAPSYYSKFKCTADKCKHTCCAGWEIDIDPEAIERFSSLDAESAQAILATIEQGDDNTPHFRLCENGNCPHLNENGLCRLILKHGEDILCDICREHPRFYNYIGNIAEVGIGASCEEACRIILQADDYITMVQIGSVSGNFNAQSEEFDALSERANIYSILSDKTIPYKERLSKLYNDYDISPDMLTDDEWHSVLTYLEYLNEAHKSLFLSYSSKTENAKNAEVYLERFLAYLIYRHASCSVSMSDFRARLGFCFFCERLFSSLLSALDRISVAEAIKVAIILSEEIEYSLENTETIIGEFDFLI